MARYDRDLGALVDGNVGITPTNQQGDGTVNGSAIDVQGYSSMVVVAQVGNITGSPTDVTTTFDLEERADSNGSWTSITDAKSYEVVSADVTDSGLAVLKVNLHTRQREIRVNAGLAFTGGTSPAATVASTVVLGFPQEVLPSS